MDFTCIFLGLLFCIFGILFAFGKIHIHMPAWKNMTSEEKSKIKIAPLCRNIGEVILLNGLIFLLRGFWEGFNEHWFTVAMIAWLAVAGFDLWFLSKKHKKKKK